MKTDTIETDTREAILLVGVNHETAPVEIREKLSFSPDEVPEALESLIIEAPVNEVMLFSTCNRVEVLFTTKTPGPAVAAIKQFICDFKTISGDAFENCLYRYNGDEAVRHIFRVASGLDSMMVGEPQIFGQVKEAYRQAVNKKTAGVILNRLIHRTFFVAKRVRSETGIGASAVSVSYAAIELGRKIFGDLAGRRVLLVGAGEMAELAVEHLVSHRVGEVYVANRTFERAVALAERFNGKAVSFKEIGDTLQFADIVISSTGAPEVVITKQQVKAVMRSRRNSPVFFIDIAVPRDIDAAVNRIENAYVYDIDDLKSVVDENLKQRRREAVKAERIVDQATLKFRTWYDSLDVVPTVVALREKMNVIADAELERTLRAMPDLADRERQALYTMADAMVNKIMHDPTLFLKKMAGKPDTEKNRYLDVIRRLFNLEE
ncbi:MAG: glutamyl-tRNA reductase [Thermodesulfobacteriota bacterium]|nr:glutamyl-tRNA reductase [Thermodesulfobacteriota bacterium]